VQSGHGVPEDRQEGVEDEGEEGRQGADAGEAQGREERHHRREEGERGHRLDDAGEPEDRRLQRTHPMDELFFVVATQNPVEFRGTYPLPESQMDRFALCLALGYVDAGTEVDVLAAQDLGHPLARLAAVVTREEVIALKARVRRVRMADELRHYVVELVRRTRSAPQVQLGCGPRASIALANAAKALALFDGEEFVRPDQVHELAVPVLAHRMVLDPQAKFAGASARALVADILREVKVPS